METGSDVQYMLNFRFKLGHADHAIVSSPGVGSELVRVLARLCGRWTLELDVCALVCNAQEAVEKVGRVPQSPSLVEKVWLYMKPVLLGSLVQAELIARRRVVLVSSHKLPFEGNKATYWHNSKTALSVSR